MDIIHSYDVQHCDWQYSYLNLKYQSNGIAYLVADQACNGIAYSPVFSASLIDRYLGVNLIPSGENLSAAVRSPEDDSYLSFNTTLQEWELSLGQVLYTEAQLNEYLPYWYKSVQFVVDVPINSRFFELKLAAKILVAYEDYLFQYALVEHLQSEFEFGYVAYPQNAGNNQTCFPFLERFSPQVTDIMVRVIGSQQTYENVLLEQGVLMVPATIEGPVMIKFKHRPQVRYVESGAYQVEKLPCIIIRRGNVLNRRRGNLSDYMAVNPTPEDENNLPQLIEQKNLWVYDLALELNLISCDQQSTELLQQQLVKKIDSQPIKIKAMSEEVGMEVGMAIKKDVGMAIATDPSIETLSSIMINCQLKNITTWG